jgi:ArsR family transcriptional regulator
MPKERNMYEGMSHILWRNHEERLVRELEQQRALHERLADEEQAPKPLRERRANLWSVLFAGWFTRRTKSVHSGAMEETRETNETGTRRHLGAFDSQRADDLAKRLKTLADPARLRLVSIVAASEGSEACVCDLITPVGLGQPVVSHHLQILMEGGLLARSKRGTWTYYKLVPGALGGLSQLDVTASR